MDSNNLIQSRRSFIFTPGLKPEMFPKAIKSGTDMVCVELEDGIAPQDKNLARKLAIKLFETNEGLEKAYDIANCSNRIDALFFGGVDMSAELKCENKWEPLLYARSRIVHAASSAGIDAIDVPFLDLDDPEGMKQEAIKAKELGFSGKGSIHPTQIPILNEVFTPSEEVIQRAKKITSTFEKANTGLVVIDGKLIEKPVLREMYRILAVAKKIEKNNVILK